MVVFPMEKVSCLLLFIVSRYVTVLPFRELLLAKLHRHVRCTLRKNQMWEHRESKNNGTELDGKYRSKFKGSATVESICMCRSTMRKKRRFRRLLLLGDLFFFFFFFSFHPTLFTYLSSLSLSLSVNSRGFPIQFPESTGKISIYHRLRATIVSYPSDKIISQRECQSCYGRLNEYGLKVLGGNTTRRRRSKESGGRERESRREGEDSERERDVEPTVETGWYLRLVGVDGVGGCTGRWNCVCILMRGLC